MTAATSVSTTDLHRRYGEGPAVVDALAGISIEIGADPAQTRGAIDRPARRAARLDVLRALAYE